MSTRLSPCFALLVSLATFGAAAVCAAQTEPLRNRDDGPDGQGPAVGGLGDGNEFELPDAADDWAEFDDLTNGISGFQLASVPNMIGDSIGGSCATVLFQGQVVGTVNHPILGCTRTKIAENNSPMPRDRVYFGYQHFHNAIENSVTGIIGGTDVEVTSIDKFLLGAERTFGEGRMSVQFQVPFSGELNRSLRADVGSFVTGPSAPEATTVEFGNISLAIKALLYENCCCGLKVSGGVLLEMPTAPNVRIRVLADPTPFLNPIDYRFLYENESYILSPFLAVLYAPNRRAFFQAFTQVENDVSGSDLFFRPIVNGVQQGQQEFNFTGQRILRVDIGGGVWLYRNPCAAHLTGVALLVEDHISSTLDDADVFNTPTPGLPGGSISLGNISNRVDINNLTVGIHSEFANLTSVSAAAIMPLRSGEEKPFDFEFQLQVNRFF